MEWILKTTMIIQWVFFLYLGFSTFYFFVFALASIFPYRLKGKNTDLHRFAVLIPGYKEDSVILEVVEESLKQTYPKSNYDVVVIADSFKPETLEALRQKNITLIEVSFEKSTKSKALNEALSQLSEEDYDLAVVLDADNIMEPQFLEKINEKFIPGRIAIQGHRIAKNSNSAFSVLDAISEEINNNVFRKGHRIVGFSSALIGSAMAFRFSYFKEIMKDVNAIGGFDKQLELKIIKNRDLIEYHPTAFVLDEKIQNSKAFSNQRKRWISAQLYYFRKDFLISFWYFISKGNLDYFNKAFQFIQPPRIMILGLLMIINVISLFFNPLTFKILWASALLMSVSGFLASTPLKFYNMKTLSAILHLPYGFFLMMKSTFFHREAKNKFIHTEHSSNINQKEESS